jgi:hypothetical protein
MNRRSIGRPNACLPITVLLPPLLCACGALHPDPLGADLEVVVLRTLVTPPREVENCLRGNAARVWYPGGLHPYVMARVPAGEGLVVEQWFSLGHRGQWVTRYELQPTASGGTEVRVRLETALKISEGFSRAAQQLVAHCTGR